MPGHCQRSTLYIRCAVQLPCQRCQVFASVGTSPGKRGLKISCTARTTSWDRVHSFNLLIIQPPGSSLSSQLNLHETDETKVVFAKQKHQFQRSNQRKNELKQQIHKQINLFDKSQFKKSHSLYCFLGSSVRA